MSEFLQTCTFVLVLVTICLASTALDQKFLAERETFKPCFASEVTVNDIQARHYTKFPMTWGLPISVGDARARLPEAFVSCHSTFGPQRYRSNDEYLLRPKVE